MITFTDNLSSYSKQVIELLKILRALIPKDGVPLPGKDKRQHDVFVQPTKNAIERYHIKYAAIFSEARNLLGDLCIEKYDSFEYAELENPKIVRKVASFIDKKRRKDAPARLTFRAEIQGYLQAVDNPEYRRFILAVGHYFISDPSEPPDAYLPGDPTVQRVLDRGGNSYYDTPATRATEGLRKLSNLGEAKAFIEDSLIGLDAKYRTLCEIYWNLQSKRRAF